MRKQLAILLFCAFTANVLAEIAFTTASFAVPPVNASLEKDSWGWTAAGTPLEGPSKNYFQFLSGASLTPFNTKDVAFDRVGVVLNSYADNTADVVGRGKWIGIVGTDSYPNDDTKRDLVVQIQKNGDDEIPMAFIAKTWNPKSKNIRIVKTFATDEALIIVYRENAVDAASVQTFTAVTLLSIDWETSVVTDGKTAPLTKTAFTTDTATSYAGDAVYNPGRTLITFWWKNRVDPATTDSSYSYATYNTKTGTWGSASVFLTNVDKTGTTVENVVDNNYLRGGAAVGYDYAIFQVTKADASPGTGEKYTFKAVIFADAATTVTIKEYTRTKTDSTVEDLEIEGTFAINEEFGILWQVKKARVSDTDSTLNGYEYKYSTYDKTGKAVKTETSVATFNAEEVRGSSGLRLVPAANKQNLWVFAAQITQKAQGTAVTAFNNENEKLWAGVLFEKTGVFASYLTVSVFTLMFILSAMFFA